MQIVINDKTLEDKLIEKSKELKIKINDLIERRLSDKLSEDSEFKYIKKDPFLNIKKLKFEENQENSTNPFKNIDDVLEYSKELRKSSWK